MKGSLLHKLWMQYSLILNSQLCLYKVISLTQCKSHFKINLSNLEAPPLQSTNTIKGWTYNFHATRKIMSSEGGVGHSSQRLYIQSHIMSIDICEGHDNVRRFWKFDVLKYLTKQKKYFRYTFITSCPCYEWFMCICKHNLKHILACQKSNSTFNHMDVIVE